VVLRGTVRSQPQRMMAWYLYGDGLKLWEEAYAPLSLVPRPGRRQACR